MNSSFAVITDATSETGYELAKQFGLNGFELLICSNKDEIFEKQRTLENLGIDVEAIKVNLGTYTGVENFYNRIQVTGKKLDVLAIHTLPGPSGDFLTTDLRDEINLINLNVVSIIHLLKKVLPDMKFRGEGKVILATSVSTDELVNTASRAFLTSFIGTLRHELNDSGVTLTLMKAGDTLFFESMFMKLKAQFHRKWYRSEHLS